MELIKLDGNTYYIKNVNNIGVYKINENEVYLIDAGNDSDCGKKIIKLLNDANLVIKGIISTHSHADHIGGNKVISDRCNAKVYSHGIENCFINYPILEPIMLYGSSPFSNLQNKFLMAKPSTSLELEDNLPDGLEYFSLKGHSPDMIGIKTNEDIYFLGDSLASLDMINKYHIFFLYDIEEYLNTLEYLKTLKGKYYVLSHSELLDDITDLIELNKKKIDEIIENILSITSTYQTFEEILKSLFDYYQLTLNLNQYVLVGSTLKSYLSYLIKLNKLTYDFIDNKMVYISKKDLN